MLYHIPVLDGLNEYYSGPRSADRAKFVPSDPLPLIGQTPFGVGGEAERGGLKHRWLIKIMI